MNQKREGAWIRREREHEPEKEGSSCWGSSSLPQHKAREHGSEDKGSRKGTWIRGEREHEHESSHLRHDALRHVSVRLPLLQAGRQHGAQRAQRGQRLAGLRNRRRVQRSTHGTTHAPCGIREQQGVAAGRAWEMLSRRGLQALCRLKAMWDNGRVGSAARQPPQSGRGSASQN